MEIEPFQMAHHAAALALWRRTPGVGVGPDDEAPGIARFLARNAGLSQVALDAGALVGTILVGHDGRRGSIHHLAVDPRARRAGVGRSLVRRALQALADEGITKCHLLVFAANAQGRAFWRAVGAPERSELVVCSAVCA